MPGAGGRPDCILRARHWYVRRDARPGGSVMRLSNWRRATFLPARARVGLSDRFRIDDLRHTAASLMIQAGYPPKILQGSCGHASITTNLDLHGHLYLGPRPGMIAARLFAPSPSAEVVRPGGSHVGFQ